MAIFFRRIATRNYRALADVTVDLRDINVLFGPNGAGKSTLLDVLWFIRDCAVRGVEQASAARSHGIGLLFDGAEEGAQLMVEIETLAVRYELSLGLSSGRIESFPGERLRPLAIDIDVDYIKRHAGSDRASFFHKGIDGSAEVSLREPDKISLGRYLDFETNFPEVADLDRRLRYIHFYPSRSFDLRFIKQKGSELSHETWLWTTGKNLWSVLQNLQGKRAVDDRYDTIIDFMRKSFPTFCDLVLEPTGPTSIYGSFVERRRGRPILASGISDGHVQMLLLLTALFAEGRERASMMLLDEPELSLHPWALAVLGEAIRAAALEHQKQVIVATHSPVLMSQFEPADCMAVELKSGRTRLRRVSEIENIGDLLEQYATGSLYISEVIAPQSTMSEGEDG
jgi:predicted ATPase